jgi:hypothetical protein
MPPRWLTLGIIVLWVGMTGWLFVREYWPQLQPGQPPPIRIELADEAQNNIPIRWSIFKDNELEPRGYARTAINFREKNHKQVRTADEWEFELWGEFKLWKTKDTKGQADFIVKNQYRVTREGELREFQSKVSINWKTKIPVPVTPAAESAERFNQDDNEQSQAIEVLELSGEVRDNFCYARMTVSQEVNKYVDIVPILKPFVAFFEREIKPVAMPKRATMLNPLEPVHKLAKVRKGQHWRVPMVDPLSVFVQGSPRLQYLNAEVLQETEWIKWGTHKDPVPCLVIKYQGDDVSGYTWVQEEDGLVVGQEITQHGDTLRLMRD